MSILLINQVYFNQNKWTIKKFFPTGKITQKSNLNLRFILLDVRKFGMAYCTP